MKILCNIKFILTLWLCVCYSQLSLAQNNLESFYLGKHRLTLQWLDDKNAGEAIVVKLTDNTLKISGKQWKGERDYLIIEGTITPIGEREFSFKGKIITCANYINQGNPCEKNGSYTFKATGKRKYWRLQEMNNCEGNNVVDYVDIFFLKH
jgi:hypothetical protein